MLTEFGAANVAVGALPEEVALGAGLLFVTNVVFEVGDGDDEGVRPVGLALAVVSALAEPAGCGFKGSGRETLTSTLGSGDRFTPADNDRALA